MAAAGRIDPAQSDSSDIRQRIHCRSRIRRRGHSGGTGPPARIPAELRGKPARRRKGAVIDGRDIGTVVCPDAVAKLFVDARPEARAHRRWLELNSPGQPADEAAVLADIARPGCAG